MTRAARLTLLALVAPLAAIAAPRSYVVQTATSTLEIDVAKAGVLSPFLHDHRFRPDRWSGTVDFDADHPESLRASLTLDAASLHDHEPAISPADEREIDETAHGPEVLDAAKFPTIRLDVRGAQLTRAGAKWTGTIDATLSLHGRTRAMKIPVEAEADATKLTATGELQFRQSDFGIRPYRRALGSIAVQDELRVRFSLSGVAK